jgi:hypothetical protein
MEKYKKKKNLVDMSYSQTRKISRANFGIDDREKKPHWKTTITIHKADYGRPRIKKEG